MDEPPHFELGKTSEALTELKSLQGSVVLIAVGDSGEPKRYMRQY